ncbi:RpiB/LacA/LacB family sugar-phosphate isomerase [Vibrio maerlii]|uniref:RpiB/LacA/LacB family sugar-phosphate isomerase n=1 Tax=Vibrio maerlii TaxID=2231648 RepID=UPI000E3E6DE7|nr:RpiB/LacA/LacB family sugar-phosphate isomerase [Vibrio maerlii]
MKIALTMENSQAGKSKMVFEQLTSATQHTEHEVFNVGMLDESDHHLTYIHLGIQASLLLNSKAIDFVVTGCGTGQGALMSLNAHSGVICGYCLEPSDAFLFNQINNGNALSLAFAKGFGWGAELNLHNMFTQAFCTGEKGQGYPLERAEPQQKNAALLNHVKAASTKDSLIDALDAMEPDLVQAAIGSSQFQACFFENSQDPVLSDYVRKRLG